MGEYIQLIDRSVTDHIHHPIPNIEWDCYFRGNRVGIIENQEGRGHWRKKFCARVYTAGNNDRYLGRMDYVGEYDTVYAAKTAMLEPSKKYIADVAVEASRHAPVAYLPSWDSDFYPTPSNVAGKLLAGVDWKNVKTVLEPSAGKGDLIDHARRSVAGWHSRLVRGYSFGVHSVELDIDCIEIDPNLQAILASKNYRVVHDDFLTFYSRKRYDLYVMNPPFSHGDEHLLHALELCENGGQIACILNAETIRNPYTNTRHLLLNKLTKAGATIRFLDNAFANAERRAKVDVALINVNIPRKFVDTTLWDNLKKAHEVKFESAALNEIAPADNVERLIREYDLTCDAGIELMRTFNGIAPHIMRSNDPQYTDSIIRLSMLDNRAISRCDEEDVNCFLRAVRLKFWRNLFDLPMLRNRMTTQMRSQYDALVAEMRDYEFSRFNIQQVLNRIMGQLSVGVEDAIIRCFEKLSNEHAYNRNIENDNVHYYNGWATNKAHCVNTRCIIPTWGCYAKEWKPDKHGSYRDTLTNIDANACFGVLDDLEKALDYLDNGETPQTDLKSALIDAAKGGRSRNIDCKYFTVTFYKKGTCHIAFKDKKIVDRLNIFVGRSKAWLPPYYGKVHYDDMDDEGRRVIDEFQGREAYENVVSNMDDYLIDAQAPLMLAE